MPKLQNKSALVTGGARGIGEAIARCFAREGASVIIADIDAKNGQRVADEIGGSFFEMDVADERGWNRLAAAHPQTDIVVNTAFRDGYIVVDQLARQFVLRRGNEATFIVNGGFTEPAGLLAYPTDFLQQSC